MDMSMDVRSVWSAARGMSDLEFRIMSDLEFRVRWASEEVRSKEDAFVHVRAGSIYLYISAKGRYRYRIASKLMIGEIPARKLSSSSHKFG